MRIPADTSSSARRDAVDRVMPVAAEISAREIGSRAEKTCWATRARFVERKED